MSASSFPSCKATRIDEINLMLDFDICESKFEACQKTDSFSLKINCPEY